MVPQYGTLDKCGQVVASCGQLWPVVVSCGELWVDKNQRGSSTNKQAQQKAAETSRDSVIGSPPQTIKETVEWLPTPSISAPDQEGLLTRRRSCGVRQTMSEAEAKDSLSL